jgi:hypothetical protein
MFRNEDNDRLAKKRRTSVCKSSVANLGKNPRVFGSREGLDGIAIEMPNRSARNCLPSHQRLLETILRCLPTSLPNGEGHQMVTNLFRTAMEGGKREAVGEPHVCATPLRWICQALPCEYSVSDVRSLDDIMGGQGMMAGSGDFFLMDVVLNRKLYRATVEADHGNPDDVVMASAKWDEANLEAESDFRYRTLVCYLPGAGVFYCASERRPAAVGLPNTSFPHDVSWLRISEDVGAPPTSKRFSFGKDGFVRRFYDELGDRVSAWRVSYGTQRAVPRFVFMAKQCSDADGPRMPPDTVANCDISSWPAAERGVEYNSHLVASKATKIGGRHHVHGSLHLTIPDDCLVINGDDSCPHVDVVVDIAPSGSFKARKTVVRVRNLLSQSMDANFIGRSGEPLLIHELRTIVLHNAMLRERYGVGGVRGSQGDLGIMHAIGTRVLQDGITTTSYTATHKVSPQLVRAYVNALSRVGQIAFPDVLAVIQNTEGDTGMKPCAAMAGDVAGNRVGYSIDTSSDLGNSSHIDSNDASQGYGLWTEAVPGMGYNWYLVMPNVHGTVPDGSRLFNGLAIRLRHGTAISWDGRLIRHCTSVPRPDGPEGSVVGSGCEQINHLYGTFTTAKEKIVAAGRKRRAKIMQHGEEFDFHVERDVEELDECDINSVRWWTGIKDLSKQHLRSHKR